MKRTWTADELLEHFTLLPDELIVVGNKSGTTRLGFAVLLKCLQYEGRFPRARQEMAPDVGQYIRCCYQGQDSNIADIFVRETGEESIFSPVSVFSPIFFGR